MFLPLAVPLASRDGTLAQDTRLLNCYWEPNAKGGKTVIKRPGLQNQGHNAAAGSAQGMFAWGVYTFAITNDTLYEVSGFVVTPMPLTVTIANQRMQVLSGNLLASGAAYAVIHSSSRCWYISDLTATHQITDADYPATTVPGIAYLDGTYYVMTPAGVIQGSDLENPASWNALNFISTDRGIGRAVAIARHLNYVVAFCDTGVQFFYDAANPAPGSPLSPSGNTLATTGCADGNTIQNIDDITIFMSKNLARGRSVSGLSGMSVVPLSNPVIDRILNRSTLASVYSLAFKIDGHAFYLLTLVDLNLTLALDLSTGDWAQWSTCPSGTTENYFSSVYYQRGFGGAGKDYLLDISTGKVNYLDPTISQDVSLVVRASGRTANLDAGSMDKKFLPAINLVGDTEVGSTVSLRYSDDDYTTWSDYRSVDMGTSQKRLTRLGSFRRRAFEWLHTGGSPMRLEAINIPDVALPKDQGDGQ